MSRAAPFCPQCGGQIPLPDSNFCGVCGAALVKLPSASPAAWDVELRICGQRKIAVIKVIREVTGLGLKEAKQLVDDCPSMVARGRDRATADGIADKLRAEGAEVRVSPGTGRPW